jgi:hypothetical protein
MSEANAGTLSKSPGGLMPVGAWVWIELPKQQLSIAGLTYFDPKVGLTAMGWKVVGVTIDRESHFFVRMPLPGGATWHRLDDSQAAALGLDAALPSIISQNYGPQPPAGSLWGAWRELPGLKGRFLPDHPDHIQVIVHDGGPRITRNKPEAVWVCMAGMEAEVCRGRVLNQPHQLQSVRQGDTVRFLAPQGARLPFMVTEKYLRERSAWKIHPCASCGLPELFDAPSDLCRAVFPDVQAGARIEHFTAFCPLCGGVQGVEAVPAAGP